MQLVWLVHASLFPARYFCSSLVLYRFSDRFDLRLPAPIPSTLTCLTLLAVQGDRSFRPHPPLVARMGTYQFDWRLSLGWGTAIRFRSFSAAAHQSYRWAFSGLTYVKFRFVCCPQLVHPSIIRNIRNNVTTQHWRGFQCYSFVTCYFSFRYI